MQCSSEPGDEQINLFGPQTKWRQQPEHVRLTGSASNDLTVEQRFVNRGSFVRELNSQQVTETVHVHYLLYVTQRFSQIALAGSYILQHSIVFNCLESGRDGGHCQHSSTKSSTEIVLLDARGDLIGNQARSHWNAA